MRLRGRVSVCACALTVPGRHVHQQLVLLVRRLAEVNYPRSLGAVHSPSEDPLEGLQQLDTLKDTELLLSHKHTLCVTLNNLTGSRTRGRFNLVAVTTVI